MSVYLLHFDKELPRSNGTGAGHYLGWAPDAALSERIDKHLKGTSKVKIIDALHRAGGTPVLVKVWPGAGRDVERYMKQMGHFRRHCPLCRATELERARRAEWERRQSRAK